MKAGMITYYMIIMIISMLISNGCKKINSEHDEAMSLEIKNIDFTLLNEGTYNGYYAGGMFGWRENECMVTVGRTKTDSGRVSEIRLVSTAEDREQSFFDELYSRVIEKQSLQVDVISGATLTSKAHLKSLENALIKAENNQ